MGSVISTNDDRNDLLKRSSVKLQAQQINAFNGNPLKWHAWKKKSRAAIGTAGMLRVLDDETYATRNRTDNETIFHLLQVATADGTAAHLVDMYEDDRDGRAAYRELIKWYEGDELTTETAEDVREKLAKISLSTKTSASQYINEFLQFKKHLDDLDEAYTTSKTVSIFLKQITDPDYRSTVEACHMNKYDLNACIEQVRAKERRLGRDRGSSRKAAVLVRRQGRVSDSDDSHNEEINLRDHKNDDGFYSIPSEKWQLLSDSDKEFVKSYNGKLRKELERKRSNTTRRSGTSSSTERAGEESPTKKLKTVTFTEAENDAADQTQQKTSDDNKVISVKRGVLGFTVKDK